ncbi:hypothetical protein WAI453_008136 [Rhynchosporium graminicola]
MLLEHDLYDEEEDEFECGRAYCGSRLSVGSGAKYWPGFDKEEGAWMAWDSLYDPSRGVDQQETVKYRELLCENIEERCRKGSSDKGRGQHASPQSIEGLHSSYCP